MLESTLERRLKNEVKKLGGKAVKFESPGFSGVPDRLVLLPGGRLVFIEMKAPGKALRPLQEKRITNLRQLGFEVFVLDSVATINQFVKWVDEDEI
ncbi:VRR-NUC domain-containing protein [Bacillus canaveralius]|uniref:VRR-NUC domain-containing protein n=1 Tax=Bacillus canaveralius TaxID=1403243 RepID=A0A2N5GPK9_9BACI|nr:VRR-NUC domain-containing protein [Bacillus canaveralius]PLR84646.1 VRR-NUC domain-containing protein [Bacillus canaveralius]PLS00798.1 VRR-NUC domain-containing protein [Bacillus canaveralius]